MSTERGDILRAARELTEGDRNEEYGDPVDQLGLAGELKELVHDRMLRDVPPAEMEALDMVLTKLSRAVMGGRPGRDTYVDIAAYAAIAGEAALRDEEDRAELDAKVEAMLGGIGRSLHSWWQNDPLPDCPHELYEGDDPDQAELDERRKNEGHTAGCYLRGFPSAPCTCCADDGRASPELDARVEAILGRCYSAAALDEETKAEIRRRGPGNVVADAVNDATAGTQRGATGPHPGRAARDETVHNMRRNMFLAELAKNDGLHGAEDPDQAARDVAAQRAAASDFRRLASRHTVDCALRGGEGCTCPEDKL